MMSRMPVAKSGEPAVIKPPMEMMRSMSLPSFKPATKPRMIAVGMETANASAARINELRILRPMTSATGA